ncbi:MAG: hypothetical protein WKF37_02335 [Bryobacteraceae bacterium]
MIRRRDLLWLPALAVAQTVEEDYQVYTEHPRLLLKQQRLRLLRREKERQSRRWLQFESLMRGKGQMPEPGFALALFYQIGGDSESGRAALEWARTAVDMRQAALVYDWCRPLITQPQDSQLASKLLRALEYRADSITSVRDAVFAAVALSDHVPDRPRQALQSVVRAWWRGKMAPALLSGERVLTHAETYPLFEILHAVRDAVQIELRDNALPFFRDLPGYRLLSYYPPSWPGAENEFRIPFFFSSGDPDLRIAALTRITELSMVAYDNNAVESQFLQGWLLHDSYQLRGTFGSPYEFLWANPYQPGLSYHHMPLQFHDKRSGQIFLRSSWNEDAEWLGFSGNKLQLFREGKLQIAPLSPGALPAMIGDSAIVAGQKAMKWILQEDDPSHWYVVGLKPMQSFDLEIDDQELAEVQADNGGVIALKFDRHQGVGVRLRSRSLGLGNHLKAGTQ